MTVASTETAPARTRNRRAKIIDHNSAKDGTTPARFGCEFQFMNGDKVTSTWFADCSKLPGFNSHIVGTITGQLVVSRVHNKLMDSYADPIEVPDAEHEARAVFAELERGVWSQRGEGGPRITLLAKAVAALHGYDEKGNAGVREEWIDNKLTKTRFNARPMTDEEAQSALDAQSKESRKSIAKDPAIAAKVAELTAAEATKRAKEAKDKAKGVALPKLFG